MLGEPNPYPSPESEARKRVFDVAETLFNERGYTAVTMRDIAEAAGIRQASLYYHVPQGKEQLFTEVSARTFGRYQKQLERVIAATEQRLETQLITVSHWFITESPLKLARAFTSDMPALSTHNAQQLHRLAHASLISPITRLFETAQQRGEIKPIHPKWLSGFFLAMMEGIDLYTRQQPPTAVKATLAAELVKVFLHGLKRV